MSTIVIQNINVSCFEPQVTETSTTVIKLKVAAPAPAQRQLTNLEFGNWGSCYQSFSNNPTNCKEVLENESFYTHPCDKKSSFSRLLSQKSLELCTENLGSETGATDIMTDDGSIFSSSSASSPASASSSSSSSSSSSLNQENSSAHYSKGEDGLKFRNKSKSRNREGFNSSRKFPPPLTTMSGSSSLQVRRHREGGRLIIEAIETPLRNSYLQAERSDGRLRLCYLTDSESESAAPPKMEEGEMEEPRNGFESGKEEFDVEKFQRLSRCRERRHENEGLCSSEWKPTAFCVATSCK